jgi:hypothetical protein
MFRSLKIILFALSAVFSVCFFSNLNTVEAVVSDDIYG